MRDEFGDAWLELDADPEVKVIVHTGEGRAFQTGVDVQELATDGMGMERYRESVENWDLHFTAWQQGVREAGDHRGQRHLRRRCVPLGGRGRHRDRGERRAVLRPARVGGPGGGDRGDRAAAQDAVRGGDAHGAGGSLRAHERRARLRARDDLADRRSAREAARGRAGAGRDHRQELAGGDARDQEGAVGCARVRPHRRVPGRRAAAGRRCGVTPTRPRARSRSPRSANPAGARPRDP